MNGGDVPAAIRRREVHERAALIALREALRAATLMQAEVSHEAIATLAWNIADAWMAERARRKP